MSIVSKIIDDNFSRLGGQLVIGNLPIRDIVARHATPLFVYDRLLLDAHAQALRSALPENFDIFYSVKANPNPYIIGHFLRRGFGLEIASSGELYQALLAGCAPSRIIFAGPGKTEFDLEYALTNRIGELHVESVTELNRVSTIAKRLGVIANIGLRVNPSGEANGGAMRMGGKPAPFGIDEEQLGDVIAILRQTQGIRLRGVHLFAGTQILDAEILAAQYKKGIEIAQFVAHAANTPLATVDFGGGLGIPYFPNEKELDLRLFARFTRQLCDLLKDDPWLGDARLIVEPGRYLVGEAGIYVSRVVDVKMSRGKKFVVIDGGMNHHLAASGNLGQTIKRNFPIAVLNKIDEEPCETVELVGPLCTPLDTLGRNLELPKVEVGDIIGIFQSGAYARSASPLNFLSHVSPAEVLVNGSDLSVIRSRGTLEEVAQSSFAAVAGVTDLTGV